MAGLILAISLLWALLDPATAQEGSQENYQICLAAAERMVPFVIAEARKAGRPIKADTPEKQDEAVRQLAAQFAKKEDADVACAMITMMPDSSMEAFARPMFNDQ